MGDFGYKRAEADRKKKHFIDGKQVSVRINKRTNKPCHYLLHVRPGDWVQIMHGKEKGKVCQVCRVNSKFRKVLLYGANLVYKNVRPQREDEVGQRVQVEAPICADVVMHYSRKEKVAGLLGIKFEQTTTEAGDNWVKKIRYNKATGEEIPWNFAPVWQPVLERTEDPDEDEEED